MIAIRWVLRLFSIIITFMTKGAISLLPFLVRILYLLPSKEDISLSFMNVSDSGSCLRVCLCANFVPYCDCDLQPAKSDTGYCTYIYIHKDKRYKNVLRSTTSLCDLEELLEVRVTEPRKRDTHFVVL